MVIFSHFLLPTTRVTINLGAWRQREESRSRGTVMSDHQTNTGHLQQRSIIRYYSPQRETEASKCWRSSSRDESEQEDNSNGETSSSDHLSNNSQTATVVRVCSDCKTTRTPLWRSGPQGPKSLCNACGIRQRKARRAKAAAENGTDASTGSLAVQPRLEKKARRQKKNVLGSTHHRHHFSGEGDKRLSFEDFAQSLGKKSLSFRQVFHKDEEEAAILLMAISCGLVCSYPSGLSK